MQAARVNISFYIQIWPKAIVKIMLEKKEKKYLDRHTTSGEMPQAKGKIKYRTSHRHNAHGIKSEEKQRLKKQGENGSTSNAPVYQDKKLSLDTSKSTLVSKALCHSFLNIRKDIYGFAIKKFLTCLMKNGNKTKAEKILLSSFFFIKKNYKPKVNKIFFITALNNVKPLIELKTQDTYKTGRSSGTNAKGKAVPITSRRAYKLAIE